MAHEILGDAEGNIDGMKKNLRDMNHVLIVVCDT